jgi:hypothetical protein
MKRILIILIIGFVFATVQAQMDNPLKKGMLNTVTLSTGEVVYDLRGEWDAIYDNDYSGTNKDIVKITQEGNKFVGIKLIGNEHKPKGSETIKGELEKNGFKSLYENTADGWLPGTGKISEKCNEIVIKTPMETWGITLAITLTRK